MSRVSASVAILADAERKGGYSSPAIIARRGRILEETRQMIAEGGIASLSMDEIARRSGVVKRTLYNAFQRKERLIVAAVQHYFREYEEKAHYVTKEATIEREVEHLIIVARRNLPIRNYTRALMDIYFSADVDPDIRMAIHRNASTSQLPLLQKLAEKRQLQDWVEIDALNDALVRARFSAVLDWGRGLIDDEDFIEWLVRSFLVTLGGATRGTSRKTIDALMSGLKDALLLDSETYRDGALSIAS